MLRLLQSDGWLLVAMRGGNRQLKHPAKPSGSTRMDCVRMDCLFPPLSTVEYIEVAA